MEQLWSVGAFLRKVRSRLRTGDLSRAPLKLLRFQIQESKAECDWVARPADPWDAHIAAEIRERNETLQALRDALAIRKLIFRVMPEVKSARFRVYRRSEQEAEELIITGTVTREDDVSPRISSLVMRAKLGGLHFSLHEGVLVPFQVERRELKVTS
jgi:hypothetical protein